jgi:hypothetical protein
MIRQKFFLITYLQVMDLQKVLQLMQRLYLMKDYVHHLHRKKLYMGLLVQDILRFI